MNLHGDDERELRRLLGQDVPDSVHVCGPEGGGLSFRGEDPAIRPGPDVFPSDFSGPVSVRKLLRFLPAGTGESHASAMKTFLYGLNLELFKLRRRGLLEAYAIRITYDHVLPIARRLFSIDREAVHHIMFPEDFLTSEEERRYYVTHPEHILELWRNLSGYCECRFPRFPQNVQVISTIFYLAQRKFLDVVELASIALHESLAGEMSSRNGSHHRVRGIEAEVLTECLNGLGSR
ncbi:MAG: hypothetical protein HGA38_03430 [Candidatus Moranbacteria bacterium]|nr:hypothetical protein [Candidatus Moranbacteria bacterium]